MLTQYKAWANEITYKAVCSLPPGEALKQRQTRFGNMVHTLNHVYVIDDVFKSHLLGTKHKYTARNTEQTPDLSELMKAQREMDQWYVNYVETHTEKQLSTIVKFEFIGGGNGQMSGAEIILHIVNHGTYHRGFVGDLLYQVPAASPANDLPVFLRNRDG